VRQVCFVDVLIQDECHSPVLLGPVENTINQLGAKREALKKIG
jgi:hypothetical protein